MKQAAANRTEAVSMSNELIRAAHNLSLMEKRVLMLTISKIDSKAVAGKNTLVRLAVSDFVVEFDIDKGSAYREVKKAIKGIRRRYVRFFTTDIDGAMIEHDIDWTTSAAYKDSEGWIDVSINGDLNPHLFELKSHFTTYKLSRASALRSVYSWRLFELLMQFKKTGVLNISTDEFKRVLEVPEAYNADFSLLRARVIEPAVKEIREKDGLAVEWEAIKAGRKVKALKFTFPTEQQTALPIAEKPIKTPTKARTKKTEPDAPSERQRSAEAQGIAQLEALARQHGIEMPKAKKMN